MSRELADLARRLENMIRYGTLEQADYPKALCRVRFADGNLSGWLPFWTRRAGGDAEWWAPDIGERVMVLSPGGEIEGGAVITGLFHDGRPAPASDPDLHVVRYQNGDVIEHNRASGSYTITVAGPVTVNSPSVTLNAPQTTATGNVSISGNLSVGGNTATAGKTSSAGGITGVGGLAFETHVHTEQGDGAATSPPHG